MKITSSALKEDLKLQAYPAHVKSRVNGIIVLALSRTCGIIVQSDISSSKVGIFDSNFNFNDSLWEPVKFKTTFED